MLRIKDYTKQFALFAIYLIISLTFFSAQALAAINYRVSGEALINKWRKADDVTIFYVNASANVSVETSPNQWTQMICTQQGNNSVSCEYFIDRNTLSPTVSNVTWKLRQESEPIQYTDATIKVDRLPPKIESLNITKTGTALKVSYSVKDYSFQNRPDCSGLDYISYVVGTEADTIDFNTTICVYNGTVIFNESGFYQEDFVIKIIAKDRLNDPIENTTIITLDLSGPDIQDEWQIMRGEQPIEIFSNDPNGPTIKYDVVIYIDDPKLDINKVRGDLSGLHINPVVKNALRNKQATCAKETENTYKCIFSEIPIKPASADLKISVNAYDKSNNFANETLEKTVTLLNDAGQVKYIGPLKEHCTTSLSKCYTAPGPQKFVGEIGLGSNFSYLLFGFSTETTPKVGPCFLKEDKWECVYNYNVPSVSQLKVFIPESSTDIYGNKLTYTERNVVVDSDPPIIIGNITSSLPSCAVASDTLKLTLIAKEALSDVLKIHVDTTGLTISDQTNDTCEKTVNDEWSCTLSITGFVTEHPPETRKVIVEDLAGNKAEKDFTFEVCAEDSNAVPNYITKITPDEDITVDRRTASLLPIKTYIPLTITKSNAGKIIEMTVDNCFAIDPEDDENEISVLDSGHYFIDDTLVLYVGFDGAALPEEEFEINCTVNSRMRAGNRVFLQPEQDSFIITAKPYNNPLGIMDSAVEQKISDQKAAIRELQGEIDIRKTINGFVMTLCTAAQIFVKINRLLQLLKSALYVICLGLEFFGIGDEIWQAVGSVLNEIDRNIQRYLWPTNLLSANWYAHAIKATCLLYTCRHYSVDGLIEIGFTASTIIDAIGFVQEENRLTAKIGEGTLSDDGKTFTTKDGKTYTKTIDANGKETWTNTKNSNDVLTYNPDTGQWSSALSIPEGTSIYDKNGKSYVITPTGAVMTLDETGQKWILVDPTTLPAEIQLQLTGTWSSSSTLPGGATTFKKDGKEYTAFNSPQGEILYRDKEGNIYTMVDGNPVLVAMPLGGFGGNTPTPPNTPTDPPTKEIVNGKEYTVTTDMDGKKIYTDSNGLKYAMGPDNKLVVRGVTPKTHVYVRKDGTKVTLTLSNEGIYEGLYVGKDDEVGFNIVYDPKTKKYIYGETEFIFNTKNTNFVQRNTENTVLTGTRYENRKVYLTDSKGRHNMDRYDVFYNTKTYTYNIKVDGKIIPVYRSPTKRNGEYIYLDQPWGNNGPGGNVIYDLTGNVIQGITGYASGEENGLGMDDLEYGNQQYAQRNTEFYTALEAENWIVNPYRSTHWDGLCFPAVLYNLQKERQVRCKYVSCMETQLAAGMPSYVCDREFGMEACLYLDSAQWHVTGGGFWDNFGAGLLKSGLAALVGMAPYAAYSTLCSPYLDDTGSPTNIIKGGPEVACGLGGTLLQLNEITAIFTADYWENFLGNGLPKDPAEIQDYCQGIDLNE